MSSSTFPAGTPIQLDIGSGGKADPRWGDGWLGVDPFCRDADVSAFMWHLPYPEDAVEAIVSCHALEHIAKAQIAPTINEWRRVLKPEGKAIIQVPDLEWCCRNWLAHQTAGWEMDTIYGHQAHPGEFHKTGFTASLLQNYARCAGLRIASFERLSSHGQMTMSLECVKAKPLALPNVSLVAVDSVQPEATLRAMKHCLRFVKFKNAFLFTDQHLDLPSTIKRIPIPKLASHCAYSEFMMLDIPVYRDMFGSSVLIVQHDGFIMNPDAWVDEFTHYDYIGAPWHDGVIGNGGFSLRSRKFLDVLAEIRPDMHHLHPEDEIVCRRYRDKLEEAGVTFAPPEVAVQFSVENTPYESSFGYHGGMVERSGGFSIQSTAADVQDLYNQARLRPSDINEHTEVLTYLASECDHVTEFVTRTAESTVAFIRARPNYLVSYNLHGHPSAIHIANAAKEAEVELQMIDANSLDVTLAETDLLFIDSYHVYEQTKQELAIHAGSVRKYIILHDTVTFGEHGEDGHPGIWAAIDEFVNENKEWELMQRFDHNNGLAILKRVL